MADATDTAVVVASFFTWYAVVPPVVGLLSGYQSVHGKFPATSLRALGKPGSIAYLLTRIAIPAAGYWLWFENQEPRQHSLLAAAAWGLGTEVVLRSRLYIGQRPTPEGAAEPVFKGMFDLVEWYQNLWLNHVGTQLAAERNTFVKTLVVAHASFPPVAAWAKNQANGWPQDQKDSILKKIAESEAAFAAGLTGGQNDHKAYIIGLAFALLDLVGEKGLTELFPKP